MLKTIDYYLDRITMYRLVLYVLIAYILIAVVFSTFGALGFSPFQLIISSLLLIAVSWCANRVFSNVFAAPYNVESFYISALILSLIVNPAKNLDDYILLGWIAILSVASKYILAIRRKHIFNPAAISLVITGMFLGQSGSWWIGSAWMTPFVIAGGFLIIRKLRFEDLAWSFFTTSVALSLLFDILFGGNVFSAFAQIGFHSFLIFMGTIMVTEPLTLPPTKKLQMIYGAIVGFLSVPKLHIGSFYLDPELALALGNIFAYIVSSRQKLILNLCDKIQIGDNILDFVFDSKSKLAFIPGQYMEWTLPPSGSDSRGNRRYFTIASSPTESTIRLGVRFYDKSSTFKNALFSLPKDTPVVASQLAGEFTLPKDPAKKIVFIAGGIGITPYRSMLKYLIDKKQKRDIIVVYSNSKSGEIVYGDILSEAEQICGVRTVYTLTDKADIPNGWTGKVGRIDDTLIAESIPDFKTRYFYLSGSFAMISSLEQTLARMGVEKNRIIKDFFPGLV